MTIFHHYCTSSSSSLPLSSSSPSLHSFVILISSFLVLFISSFLVIFKSFSPRHPHLILSHPPLHRRPLYLNNQAGLDVILTALRSPLPLSATVSHMMTASMPGNLLLAPARISRPRLTVALLSRYFSHHFSHYFSLFSRHFSRHFTTLCRSSPLVFPVRFVSILQPGRARAVPKTAASITVRPTHRTGTYVTASCRLC